MDQIEKINAICESILKLTDEDIKAVEQMAQSQSSFHDPLKMKRTEAFRELGDHNSKVISGLKDLRKTLIKGTPIS